MTEAKCECGSRINFNDVQLNTQINIYFLTFKIRQTFNLKAIKLEMIY